MLQKIRNVQTRKLVLAAMFCALTFLGTCIAIPVPVAGNLNFGDGFLLVAAWTLGCHGDSARRWEPCSATLQWAMASTYRLRWSSKR